MLVRRHRPVWEEFQEYRIVLEILFVNPITLYQFPFVSVFSAFLRLRRSFGVLVHSHKNHSVI